MFKKLIKSWKSIGFCLFHTGLTFAAFPQKKEIFKMGIWIIEAKINYFQKGIPKKLIFKGCNEKWSDELKKVMLNESWVF